VTDQEKAELLAAAIRERRSINLFEPGPIDSAVILEAIELARWAPNHRLTEPWRFYVLGSAAAASVADLAAAIDAAEKGERAGELRRQRLLGIPGSLVLTSRRDENELIDRENYAACCCAAQNLMLYLGQRGIGTKWTTGLITRDPRFYAIMGADPASELVVGHFWYGRPKLAAAPRRSPLADFVFPLD
jgi:nitroreductase